MYCSRNIITAAFPAGKTETTTAPLWQWDYGQALCITGIDLPAAFEVHFSTNRTGGVSTVAVGADGQVTIPNELLTIGKNLNAWIYLSDAQGEGETEYSILIPVKARPMPETYDAEVTGEFDDVVRQVSEYAETAQTAADNAGASASAAATSASEAAASASAAESAKTAAETAQGKAEDAQAAAETAAQTATEKAQQSAQDASQAALDAGKAESAAGRAEAAKTGAESAKTDAETAAQGAADSASAASASATSAGQSANAAAGSASAAAQSAASIEGDVQIASQKASEATTAAGQAVTAKDAAVTARQGAETAATNAGQSASTATAKAAEAAQSASSAAQSKTDAEAAAARAEQAAATLTVDTALSDTSTNPVQNKVITGAITDVKDAITQENDSANIGLLAFDLIKKSYVNAADGSFVTYKSSPIWSRTDYVKVTAGDTLTVTTTRSGSDNAFYKADKTFDSSFSLPLGESKLTIPDGVVFLAISSRDEDMQNLVLKHNIFHSLQSLDVKLDSAIAETERITTGDIVYSKNVLLAFDRYTDGELFITPSTAIGKNISEISKGTLTGSFTLAIDIAGYSTVTYLNLRNFSGYGALMIDSNNIVVWVHYDADDGDMERLTFDVPTNATKLILPFTQSYVADDFNVSLTGSPRCIDELYESNQSLAERVTILENKSDHKAENPAILDAEIVGFICYGQSWSMGYDTNAIVSAQRYDNLMLNSGLMNDPVTDLVVSANSFSPLTEKTVYTSTEHTTRCGETPCTAQTDIIKQLLFNENGYDTTDIKYQIFSAAPGMGNKSLEELAYGTDYYNRLIDVVRTANNLARAQGKVFVVPAISWAQGRATLSDDTYYDQLEQLRLHMDTDIKAITGQTIPVKLIAWQAVFGSTTPKRFYDRYVYASEKYENIICSGTFYNYDHVANKNLHLTANSQDWLGAQFGIAYKRSIVDGEKFIPLKPKKAEVYGNIVYVDFYVPVKPLTFDTTLVAEATNKGFQIIDANSTEKNITAVEIVSPDRVKLVCLSDVASTDHIVYGNVGGTDYSPTTGKRGNLRDSQNIVYKNHNSVDLPCYNWCVVFDKTIAELTPST